MIAADIIQGIRQHIDLQNLVDYLTDIIYQFCAGPSSLLLWESKRKCFLVRSQRGVKIQEDLVPRREGALVQWLSSNHSDLLINDHPGPLTSNHSDRLVCDSAFGEKSHPAKNDALQELKNLKAQVCFALRSDDSEIIGLLLVGKKKDGGDYSEEELNILGEIAKQSASTMERIKIYTQMIEERVYANLGKIAIQIAHDLNSPLSSINVFLQFLAQDTGWKKEVRPDLANKFFTIAQKEMKRATAIIKNLLMYSRPGRSIPSRIAVNHLMDEVLEISREQLTRHTIQVIRHYYPQEIVIPGEREQLTRLFINLVQNAVESMDEKESRQLIISTAREECMAVISIQDTGSGIPDEIKDYLFIPFVTSGKKNGLGLGLSIIERFVTLHGGDIQVKTDYDQGTCFMVRLPLEKRGSQRLLATSFEAYRIPQNEALLIQDISATGLRLCSREYIHSHQLLRLFINLPDNLPPIPVLGKVVWIKEIPDRKGLPYDLGLEFLDIGLENRERVIRWIDSEKKTTQLQLIADEKLS